MHPHQYSSNPHPNGAQPVNQQNNAQQPTNQQKIQFAVRRLAYIKGECHQAVHPTVIRDRLKDVIELLEWVFAGQISDAQPHVVPGVPAGIQQDSSAVRVEFTSGPGAVAAAQQAVGQIPGYFPDPFTTPISPNMSPAMLPGMAQPQSAPQGPINSGDVHFIPGPPPGSPGAVGGQTVEYYNGPGQANNNGQRVEFFGNPNAQAQQAPAPATNQPQQIVPNPPTLTTEAGQSVAPIPGNTAQGNSAYGNSAKNQNPASAPSFLFPGFPPPAGVPEGVPRTVDELRSKLPIPLAE